MKKWLLIVSSILFLSSASLAAKMSDYIQIWESINTLKQSSTPQSKDALKNLEMILTTIDQTMAETITLMIANAEQNHKPVFCLPKTFNLTTNDITKYIMQGFNNSNMAFEQKKELPAVLFVIEELHRQYACGAAFKKEPGSAQDTPAT